MEPVDTGTWAGLLALGAFHGVNPAMGWLFAVARGMQERRRTEVWRALVPLGLGHLLAVGAAVLVAAMAGRVLPTGALRWAVAALLVALGARRLVRHGHPRWRGMRVGASSLAWWSFLMASAHGAGLMVVPFVLGDPGSGARSGHLAHVARAVPGPSHLPAAPGSLIAAPATGLALTIVHAAGYLAVSAVIATVVYEKVGVRFLRTGWVNLDLLWAVALIVTGVVTVVV